jgi:hypothetical protein
MNARVCLACGEPLLTSARIDKSTCGPACRARLCRTRKAACNTSVTRSGATTLRSGPRTSARPPAGQIGPSGVAGEPGAHPTNSVILALVVALRDVESRRVRGNVLTDPTAKEPIP